MTHMASLGVHAGVRSIQFTVCSLISASNMMYMEWDDELAEVAQTHADLCVFEHDCRGCRQVGTNQLYITRTATTEFCRQLLSRTKPLQAIFECTLAQTKLDTCVGSVLQ